MRSPDRAALAAPDAGALLEVARGSIEHGLASGRALEVDPDAYPPALRAPGAAFVTLRVAGELRGCTGELEVWRPLVASVAHHAYAAAFRDPRFAPLAPPELDRIDLHISVLGPLEPIDAASEAAVLAALAHGLDGLLIDDGSHRATFLPAVWASIPEAPEFLRELKQKAGLAARAWPGGMRAWRYRVQEIPDEPAQRSEGPGSAG
jgi:AmmeMemoRadiSam system protein A